MSSPTEAAAIVLAAGASRRMGRNKMLESIGRETLIGRSVRTTIAAGFAPVIVVVGHQAAEAQDALAGLDCQFVFNPAFDGPTSTSLHAGLGALPHRCTATAIVLADMPLVTEEMLRALPEAIGTKPLAVSRYGDVFAPPLLFRRALFPALLAWHGEGCGKRVVLRHLEEAAIVDWPTTALHDIDTPEDLTVLQQ